MYGNEPCAACARGILDRYNNAGLCRLDAMNTPSRRLLRLVALLAVLLVCALAASALLGWTPGAKGLPADVASVYQPGAGN
jgi:hypothetical protein